MIYIYICFLKKKIYGFILEKANVIRNSCVQTVDVIVMAELL